jgi:hypothetical protein
LRANGHDVYGFGQRKTPEAFVNACNTFLFLESLTVPDADDAVEHDGASAAPAKLAASSAKTEAKPAAATKSKPLSQDTKLVTNLRGAVDASMREDGWASMSAVGSAFKRQSSIDPSNYGLKTFSALIEKTGLFEVVRADGGHAYVADKRNRKRSKTPTI